MGNRRVTSLAAAAILAIAATVVVTARGSCDRGTVVSRNAAQADPFPVQVLVTKLAPTPGGVMYRYTVINGGPFPVTALLVGFDEYYGVPKLASEPLGWDGDSLPVSSFQAPPGWTCTVESTEGDSLTNLKWEIEGMTGAIMGGESLGGFAVTLAQSDATYEGGGLWTVYVRGESPMWGSIQPSGVTAAPLSSMYAKSDLRISPNPARGPVKIQFAIPNSGQVTVDIFDVTGRRVKRIMDDSRTQGNGAASWNGRDDAGKEVAAGVYFVRVRTATTQRFGRITWMRGGK